MQCDGMHRRKTSEVHERRGDDEESKKEGLTVLAERGGPCLLLVQRARAGMVARYSPRLKHWITLLPGMDRGAV